MIPPVLACLTHSKDYMTRSNASFCVGVVLEHAGDAGTPHYGSALHALGALINDAETVALLICKLMKRTTFAIS